MSKCCSCHCKACEDGVCHGIITLLIMSTFCCAQSGNGQARFGQHYHTRQLLLACDWSCCRCGAVCASADSFIASHTSKSQSMAHFSWDLCGRQTGQQVPSAATKCALYQFLQGLLTDNPFLVPASAFHQPCNAPQGMPEHSIPPVDRYFSHLPRHISKACIQISGHLLVCPV